MKLIDNEIFIKRNIYARRPDWYLELSVEDKIKYEPTDQDCMEAGFRDLNSWHNHLVELLADAITRSNKHDEN